MGNNKSLIKTDSSISVTEEKIGKEEKTLLLLMNRDYDFQIITKEDYNKLTMGLAVNKKYKNIFIKNPLAIEVVTKRSELLCFTQSGRYFSLSIDVLLKINELKELFSIETKDKIVDVIPIPEELNDRQSRYLIFVTNDGLVKRSKLELFLDNNPTYDLAVKLKVKDFLVNVKLAKDNDRVLIGTKLRKAIRVDIKWIKEMSKLSFGIKGIKLAEERDGVLGMAINESTSDYAFTMTERGNAKINEIEDYRSTNIGGSGVVSVLDKKNTGKPFKI